MLILFHSVTNFFFFFFLLFRAAHVAYRSFQARGRIGTELQLPAYTTAAATQDPYHVCNLHHSSQQRQILSPTKRDQRVSWILVGSVLLCHSRSSCYPLASPNLLASTLLSNSSRITTPLTLPYQWLTLYQLFTPIVRTYNGLQQSISLCITWGLFCFSPPPSVLKHVHFFNSKTTEILQSVESKALLPLPEVKALLPWKKHSYQFSDFLPDNFPMLILTWKLTITSVFSMHFTK